MRETSVLFVCGQRGARSRIAELYCNQLSNGEITAEAACCESGGFGDLVGELLAEDGLSLPKVDVPLVYRHLGRKRHYDYVVFMCRDTMVEICELFHDDMDRLFHDVEVIIDWSLPPFSAVTGDAEQRASAARSIRDKIRGHVEELISAIRAGDVTERFHQISRADMG